METAKLKSKGPAADNSNSAVRDIWFMSAIIVFCVLACLPLFKGRLILTHDSGCAFIRLLGVYKFCGDGQILTRWIPDLNFGYGYPLFNFYPPLFYYLAYIFILGHIGVVNAINIACISLWIFSGLGMYLFARGFFGKDGAFLAAIAYIYAPYHICDLYVRGSFAEFSSFAIFPFILWSLFRLNKTAKPIFIITASLSICLLLLSHNIMAMLFIPVILAYVLFLHIVYNKGDIKKSVLGIFSFISGMALSAFFWLPAVVEKKFVRFTNFLTGFYEYKNHFVYPDQLVYSKWGYGESVAGRGDTMSFMIGGVHLLLAIASIILIKRIYKRNRDAGLHMVFFSIIALGAIIFTTEISLPIWKMIPLLQFTQFPWRFLAIIVLCVSFLAGGICLAEGRYKKIVLAAAVFLVFITNIFYCRPNPAKPLWDSRTTNAADLRDILILMQLPDTHEYTPVWAKEMPDSIPKEKLIAIDGTLNTKEKIISAIERVYDITAATDVTACFNTFYFPGWKVLIDGRAVEIDPVNKYGLIYFKISKGDHSVRIKFGDTPIRLAAKILSFTALAGLIIMCGYLQYSKIFVKRFVR